MMDYYQILGVSVSASHKEIVAAYRAKCKLLHPDVNPSADATAQMQMVNEAYHTLSNDYLRRQYDERYCYYSSMDNSDSSESYESNTETPEPEWWEEEYWHRNTSSSWYAKHCNDNLDSKTPSWLTYMEAVLVMHFLARLLRALFNF